MPASKRHVARQGALLFSGFAVSQALSFVRNAVIGHGLSKGDFGIAATITLILQLVETLSDLGSDRLIVQAENGDHANFVATAHTVLVARGFVIFAVLYLGAPYLAGFFAVDHAVSAFRFAAFVPLIKGFTHLDCRRAQRRLDNRPQMVMEVVPQAVALMLTLPALALTQNYAAVVWVSLLQAIVAVAVSHILAERPYKLAADEPILRRQIAFGWPILASALPLIAVYQGDRIIIARVSGMESLAAYTAAFMVTMVPGLIAAKVGHSLLLPMFSDFIRRSRSLKSRFTFLTEVTTLAAALYLAIFLVAGERLLPLVFGANYQGLGSVLGWLALMWALRMMQAVPGMALMAAGQTRPFLIAGMIRALALPVALWSALGGASIATIAAIGAAAEAMSLMYVGVRVERFEAGLGLIALSRALFIIPAALTAYLSAQVSTGSLISDLIATIVVTLAIAGIGVAVMPSLCLHARRLLESEAAPATT